ncbi:hypothetical protein HK104_002952 [Borealophlyctis nickersoniae]|nr:hypothetical protein HK104_002952 [Borealophlyctis nickersoniae]
MFSLYLTIESLYECAQIIQVVGIHLAFGSKPLACSPGSHVPVIFHALVILSCGALILWFIIVLALFLRSTPLNVDSIDHAAEWRRWLSILCFGHARVKNVTPSPGSSAADDPDVLTDVARVFAEFFADAVTVPSDILVGLILLRRKQKQRRVEALLSGERERHSRASGDRIPLMQTDRRRSIGEESGVGLLSSHGLASRASEHGTRVSGTSHGLGSASSILSANDNARPATYEEIANIIDVYQFAESIYGLPLYIFTNFMRGLLHVFCPRYRPPVDSAATAVRTHIEPGCGCACFASSTISDTMGASGGAHADLVHLSMKNGLFVSPYVVCFHHSSRTVVIAVRGTLSTADILVDLNCDLAEIRVPGLAEGVKAYTHSGMLRTARNIKSDLENRGFLREMLLEAGSPYRDYKLVVCGHSLGGGVASLLGFLLRTNGYSNTIVYAYAPPGCMVTAAAIPYFETFCTSIVLGADVVPRLNRNTVERLKVQCNAAIRKCDRPKLQVLGSFLLAECFGVPWQRRKSIGGGQWEEVEDGGADGEWRDLERGSGEEEEEEGLDDACRLWGEGDRVGRAGGHPTTYLPGRILYFRKERQDEEVEADEEGDEAGDDGGWDERERYVQGWGPIGWWRRRQRRATRRLGAGFARDVYRPVWARPEDFQDIVISVSMGADHMPHNLRTVLDKMEGIGKAGGSLLTGVSY